MTRANILKMLFALWIAFFVWSFVYFMITEPDSDGFTRGFNRIMGFGRWQALAIIFAALCWTIGGKLEIGNSLRKLSKLPMIVEFLLMLCLMAFVAYFTFVKEHTPEGDPFAPSQQTAPVN